MMIISMESDPQYLQIKTIVHLRWLNVWIQNIEALCFLDAP